MCNVSRAEGEARCANGGECVDGLGQEFTCICSQGWEGDTCEDEVSSENAIFHKPLKVDECAEDPCLNDGHCIDLLGDFSCSCPLTWTGRRCEELVES